MGKKHKNEGFINFKHFHFSINFCKIVLIGDNFYVVKKEDAFNQF